MNARTKRFATWTLVALAVVVLMGWALWPRPQPADLAAVVRAPLEVTLDEEGETRVHERFVVSAPLAGKVLRIELEPGDPVRAGETVLATFQPQDPTPLDARSRAAAEALLRGARAAVEEARAQRDRAKTELEFAEAELRRFRRLAAEQIVPQDRLEAAEADARARAEALAAAEGALDNAGHRVEEARARLLEVGALAAAASGQPVELRSPVDGVVLRRLRESEAVVPAGEALLELGDPEDLEIVADYLSSDAVRIRPGQRVRIEEWGGPGALEGRVRRVEPSGFMKVSALGVEEQRVNVIIDFAGPREARRGLADGFRVEVRVVVWEGSDVLQVPLGSLLRRSEEWAVFAVAEGRARLVELEIGQRGERAAEVLGGLAEGATVILHPGDAIADGVRVTGR